jgi:hypothetical protein
MLSSTVIGEVIHPRSKLAGYSTGNQKHSEVCEDGSLTQELVEDLQ